MTQQARRAASGGRVSALKGDTKSRLLSAKKSQLSTHVPPHKTETVSSQAKKVVSENGESTSRPKTWPLRVLEVSEFYFLMMCSYCYVFHLTFKQQHLNHLGTLSVQSFLAVFKF
jgi:hypothetical protein